MLGRFPGFGCVALSIFPNPVTGEYKDPSWRMLGEELQSLLSPEEYVSAKRTTFNAFDSAPTRFTARHAALGRLGVPEDGSLVVEPGCGTGNFLLEGKRHTLYPAGGAGCDLGPHRPPCHRHPDQDIRIEETSPIPAAAETRR